MINSQTGTYQGSTLELTFVFFWDWYHANEEVQIGLLIGRYISAQTPNSNPNPKFDTKGPCVCFYYLDLLQCVTIKQDNGLGGCNMNSIFLYIRP